jgi:hypothetical protein
MRIGLTNVSAIYVSGWIKVDAEMAMIRFADANGSDAAAQTITSAASSH